LFVFREHSESTAATTAAAAAQACKTIGFDRKCIASMREWDLCSRKHLQTGAAWLLRAIWNKVPFTLPGRHNLALWRAWPE